MSTLHVLLMIILGAGLAGNVRAQAQPQAPLEVEWYPPETEKSASSDRSRVVISGRTASGSLLPANNKVGTSIRSSAIGLA